MTSRRHFLQTMAALPPTLSLSNSWAANPDPSRLAMVIGNSNYRDAPLDNPVNDARSVAGLFDQAGFTVSSHLNARRTDMMSAIERFAADVSKAETKLVVFYYAGHGVQLDWRNYLIPVDAAAQTADQLRQSCIDLNQLISQLGKSKNKTFVVILDACRNNPFGSAYKPEQQGLSQFDAPVGSLLAYATSPGSVASDGSGQNGLYTENLVRELSVRGTRIEDALKRVRLNVRLASGGAQIPWETTSLESDVFIFNDGNNKLSVSEQERVLEADFSEWARIKSSTKIDDWVVYLKNYPNGRFAEIAQSRLTRLLAEKEKTSAISVASAAPAPAQEPAPAMQVIELRPGGQAPELLQTSVNPFSAGRYPLARKFSVGDEAVIRVSDMISKAQTSMLTLTVTRVDVEADRVELNSGVWIMDLMGNFIQTPNFGAQDLPQQMVPAELQLGKKWTSAWKEQNPNWGLRILKLDMSIVAFEKLRIAAGEFDVFRIEGNGWVNAGAKLTRRYWVAPGLNFALRYEHLRTNNGRYFESDRYELVSLRQQSLDPACTTRSPGNSRSFVIKSSCG
jgi:hypothetical protein